MQVVSFIQENENEIVIKLYGQAGMPLTYKQKEIEQVYMSELFYYVMEKEMGRNKLVHVSMNEYIEVILSILISRKYRCRSFIFLLIREMIRCNIYLCSSAKTWLYSYMDLCKRTKDHVKALMKSSKANMALIFSEQGNHFELYDKHSNIYQGTDLKR